MKRSDHVVDRSTEPVDGEVLERNVAQLIARAHEAPRMSPQARARILTSLKNKVARAAPESTTTTAVRRPRARMAWAVGFATLATAGLVVGGLGLRHRGSSARLTASAPRQVMLADGSELLLNRDAEVIRVGRRRLRLVRGEVVLDVAKDGTPFVVDTPQGRVVVLGTRFALGASDSETWAAVMRGRVRIQNASGAALLRAGERGVLKDGVRPVRRAAPRLSHLTSWAKVARRHREKQAPRVARRGALVARNPQWQQQEFPLPMRELVVDVHVENQVARVALDQTFFNPQRMQLEGVYQFALPPGASVSRQAMYVGGRLMESAIVERTRGRRIYEDIVYRRKDPALMEWMAGNMFKVRIFPLPPRQEKRILLEYTQSIDRLYDDYKIEIPMPEVDAPVRRLRFRARVVGCGACVIKSTSHPIEVTRDGDDAVVAFERRGDALSDDILLTVREPQIRPRLVSYQVKGQTYWMARVQPGIDASTADRRGRRWVLLHDTSASRSSLERKAQAFIIDRLLRELDEDDEVAILAFDSNVRTFSSGFVRVGDVDRVAAARFLRAEGADGVGHTDLHKVFEQAASMLAAAGGDKDSHMLYLGDGIATADERRIEVMRKSVVGRARFVGVAVGARMDARLLRSMAAATDGMFVAINPGEDLAWRTFDLVAALQTPRVVGLTARFVDAAGQPMEDADTIVSARQLADGEQLTLTARSPSSAVPAAVELSGQVHGAPWSRRVALSRAERTAAYLPRLWAQGRIDMLLEQGATEHRKEITKLGLAHYLMTPFTSLLVLENDAMYKKYAVSRDGGSRWAAYPAPAKIKVVREAFPSRSATAVRGATIFRTPTRMFYGYGYVGLDVLTASPSIGVGDLVDFTSVVGGGGGTGAAFDRDENGRPVADQTTWSVTRGPRRALDIARLGSGPRKPFGGRSAGNIRREDDFRSPDYKTVEAARIASQLSWDGRWWGRGWGGGKGGYYRYGGNVTPPRAVAFNHLRDVRLDDLTEFVPGLFPLAIDRTASAKGGALPAVRRTPRKISAGRFTSDDGAVIDVDRSGRFHLDHWLPTGLRERIVFDGKNLYHVYPKLGLATRRVVADVELPVDTKTFARAGKQARIEAPSEQDVVMVEMSLRAVAHWTQQMSREDAGSRAWRHSARQLLASYAATHDEGGMRRIMVAIASAGLTPTRGELTLASRGLARVGTRDLARELVPSAASDSVSLYIRAATRLARLGDRDAFDGFALRTDRSLADMLARYRLFLSAAERANTRGKALRLLDELAQRYPASPFLYVGANIFSNRWSWSSLADSVRAWELVGNGSAFTTVAEYQAVRILYMRGKYAKATARIDRALDRGAYDFPVDATIRNAFRASPRGDAGWRMFWSRWRHLNLKRTDPWSIVRLLRAAVATGETADVDRAVARATQLDIEDDSAALALIDAMRRAGRNDQAMSLLRPRLAANPDSTALLARATTIAEAQGRLRDAVDYLQRVLKARDGRRIPLSVVRRDYRRLVTLQGRAAQSETGAARDATIAAALQSVAAWRRIDPDNTNLDRVAARLLYSVARPTQAHRYLMTAIERHPGEGQAYDLVATELQREGEIAEAVRLWKRAADVDPTNPTWLLRRVRGLATLGKRGQARTLLDSITNKKWHNRFARIVSQAKQLRRAMAK